MATTLAHTLLDGISRGDIVPYLGPGALKYITDVSSSARMPADSDSLIYGMTGGQAMSPRLMYEFPRAAMHLENKKGRKFIERYLTATYAERQWQPSALHNWLASLHLPYIVDTNRDSILPLLYQDREHWLVVGAARLAGTHYRFDLYHYQDGRYEKKEPSQASMGLPILFKPYGTPIPHPSYVASDADFVDYITELMGGFAIPAFLKTYRQDKQYAFMGMGFNRDTERMVMSEIIYAAGEPAGWALLPAASQKEARFCQNRNITVLAEDWDEHLFPLRANDVA